jgi:4-hydroxybenzoate polyprenyltransferase
MIKHIWLSMRPHHWVKNVFIFAGLLFSENIFSPYPLVKVSAGFMIFSLAASSIYILNDIIDIENDRQHPKKRSRPLAAGRLSISGAWAAAVILALVAASSAFWIDRQFSILVITYIVINIFYTWRLKHLVILDVMCIASGFVLRVLAGTALAGVIASNWLIICTITLSLFLGFSKRRHEIVLIGNDAQKHRKVLAHYSLLFLDQMIAVATASTVIAYALYTVSEETIARFGTRNLIFTLPFVFYGIYRYLYIIHEKQAGGNPTHVVLHDRPLLINCILWGIVVTLIIYQPFSR